MFRKHESGRTMILPSITTSTFSNSQIWILALVWRNRKIRFCGNERERRLEMKWWEGRSARAVRAGASRDARATKHQQRPILRCRRAIERSGP